MRYTIINGELYHYGVPGMKWGQRRQRSKDSAEVKAIRKKRVKAMSNEELKKANNRLNLEQQYKNYTKPKITPKKLATDAVKTATLAVNAVVAYKKLEPLVVGALGKIAKRTMSSIDFNVKI